jgi:hypothetical protein
MATPAASKAKINPFDILGSPFGCFIYCCACYLLLFTDLLTFYYPLDAYATPITGKMQVNSCIVSYSDSGNEA